MTNEGKELLLTGQVGRVARPLLAVSQVMDAGHFVMLDSTGGWLVNIGTHEWTRINRVDDVYEIDLWLKETDADGRCPEPSHSIEDQVNAALRSTQDQVTAALRSFKEALLNQPGFARQE